MPLLAELSDLRSRLQDELFPSPQDRFGSLTDKIGLFVTVLETTVRLEAVFVAFPDLPGRPSVAWPSRAASWPRPCSPMRPLCLSSAALARARGADRCDPRPAP